MPIVYRTSATATGGGRSGTSTLDDGSLSIKMTVPKESGGDGAPGNNPEQLFALGYSACFLGALRFVAGKAKVKLGEDTTVSVKVGMGPREDGGGFGLDVAVVAHMPGVERAIAEDLVAQAHIVCPYSHAMRTATEVSATVG